MIEKITEQLIVDDIKKIVAREVKELKRKKEALTLQEISMLEKLTKVVVAVMEADKNLAQNLQELGLEELESLAD